jgi:[phosphatase 2A protein]-leucine-carboxy methyltransferase
MMQQLRGSKLLIPNLQLADAFALCRSATQLGYLADPFVSLLYKTPHNLNQPSRKSPLINVGTHHRTFAIDMLVEMFLRVTSEMGIGAQIVSLGAGSDTRFFRLMVS